MFCFGIAASFRVDNEGSDRVRGYGMGRAKIR